MPLTRVWGRSWIINMITTAIVTAYCLLGTMASGNQVYDGAVACPRAIPLGTKVCIEHKLYVCEDRTAKKYDGRYDIWMSSCDKAVQWGKRKLEVIIIK